MQPHHRKKEVIDDFVQQLKNNSMETRKKYLKNPDADFADWEVVDNINEVFNGEVDIAVISTLPASENGEVDMVWLIAGEACLEASDNFIKLCQNKLKEKIREAATKCKYPLSPSF